MWPKRKPKAILHFEENTAKLKHTRSDFRVKRMRAPILSRDRGGPEPDSIVRVACRTPHLPVVRVRSEAAGDEWPSFGDRAFSVDWYAGPARFARFVSDPDWPWQLLSDH